MKRLVRMILSRTTVILLLLLLQIAVFFLLLHYLSKFTYVHTIFYIISDLIVVYLIYKEENPIYKLSWIVPILIFPLFGGLFYLFYRNRNVSKKVLNHYHKSEIERFDYLKQYQKDISYTNRIPTYLHQNGWMAYDQSYSTFLGSGKKMFESMKLEISKAKKYIFLEFFVIKKGQMWDELLKLLKLKAKEGIDIYLIYDDFGSSSLPQNYTKILASYGIKAFAFNPMRIHLNFAMNYRDHRKIVIIDGKICFTGGINIGDEYINLTSPYGHWMDAGIKFEGGSVTSLVINFINTLKFMHQVHLHIDDFVVKDFDVAEKQGILIPFSDAPIDQEEINKNMYLSMISQAQKEICITTPYLIIDNELKTALQLAARSGVKVNIIIPYIPDKKLVFYVTETYAKDLAKFGVNIYRYTPGFIHSKLIIVDQKIAMIGTANLDFRSLYLHFENSVYLENLDTIKNMNVWFNEQLKESTLATDLKNRNIFIRILSVILRGFSSIM
ncbi:MAG: cardiolipin synthase [Acholeplasmataceae bacterium]